MARLVERMEAADRAMERFSEALSINKPSSLERDAAIQRFEFTFEAIWKAAKAFLLEYEGIEAASPKSVIRSCRELGILSDDEATLALQMTDDRNLTVHTYNEPLAIKIHSRLHDYYGILEKLQDKMKAKIDKSSR